MKLILKPVAQIIILNSSSEPFAAKILSLGDLLDARELYSYIWLLECFKIAFARSKSAVAHLLVRGQLSAEVGVIVESSFYLVLEHLGGGFLLRSIDDKGIEKLVKVMLDKLMHLAQLFGILYELFLLLFSILKVLSFRGELYRKVRRNPSGRSDIVNNLSRR